MDCLPDFHLHSLVSVFLDRAIDNGLIVPVLFEYEDGNSKELCICQAYRHGEDLPYGHADKERFPFQELPNLTPILYLW